LASGDVSSEFSSVFVMLALTSAMRRERSISVVVTQHYKTLKKYPRNLAIIIITKALFLNILTSHTVFGLMERMSLQSLVRRWKSDMVNLLIHGSMFRLCLQ
jgi:hypothetical protein